MTKSGYNTEQAHTSSRPPRGAANFFNGSFGLLNGNNSSYNAADAEADQEMAERLRRRKKNKRKRGTRL